MNYFKRLSCLPWISREKHQGFLSAQQSSSRKLLSIAIATVFVGIPTSRQAASFISDCTDLQGSARVESSLGVISTFEVLPNNFSVTSEQGLKLNIQIPQALSSPIKLPVVFQTLPTLAGIPVNFATGVPTNFAINIQAKPLPEPDSSVLITLGVIWLALVAIRCTWFCLQASKTKRKI